MTDWAALCRALRTHLKLTPGQLDARLEADKGSTFAWETYREDPLPHYQEALRALAAAAGVARDRAPRDDATDARTSADAITDWPACIKALRARHGWTKRELAKRLGVSVPSVHNWERGRNGVQGRYQEALRRLMDAPNAAAPTSSAAVSAAPRKRGRPAAVPALRDPVPATAVATTASVVAISSTHAIARREQVLALAGAILTGRAELGRLEGELDEALGGGRS